MFPRILRSICTVLVFVFAVYTFSSQAESASVPFQSALDPLVVRNLGQGAISLDGPWRFHLGDNPAWANPDLGRFQLGAA